MSRRTVAALELVLLFPAALFMAALIARGFQSAHTAQQLVMWYARHMWTLWILLLALPFTALVIGGATLLYNRRSTLTAIGGHFANTLVAVSTVVAGGILVIVVLHMAAN